VSQSSASLVGTMRVKRINGSGNSNPEYSQIHLDDFSDDDDDDHARHDDAGGRKNGNGANDASSSIHRQQQMFQEQDHGLELLGKSAERLGQMSMAIHDELGFQNKMLDEMEADLDETADNLDLVTRKTKEFIDRAGGTKNCLIIASLTAVAILLFFLILYT
jgi:SNARE domain